MKRVNRAYTRRLYNHKRAALARFFVSSDDRPYSTAVRTHPRPG